MFDQKASDTFFNNLAASLAQHLENLHREASVAATTSALNYADTNDGQHRALYLFLRKRSDTCRKISQVLTDDASITPANRDKLLRIFNGGEPTKLEVKAADPAPVIVTDTPPVPATAPAPAPAAQADAPKT
jgi:hypothetical protein